MQTRPCKNNGNINHKTGKSLKEDKKEDIFIGAGVSGAHVEKGRDTVDAIREGGGGAKKPNATRFKTTPFTSRNCIVYCNHRVLFFAVCI